MRLSYSKLKTYRQCPLRYRFTYLERLPRRPRRLFRAGRRIHHALMHWLTYARQGAPRWEDIRAAYDTAWDADSHVGPAEDRDYAEGLEILRQYHEANLSRPCRPVLLEHKFSVPLGPHVLIGAMDRVDVTDSGYAVIDYKLDREVRSQEEVDEDLQLGLYSVALQFGKGIQPETLSLYFLRHNLQRTTVRTPQQNAELAEWVIETGQEIQRQKNWEPCSGQHCQGCDFRAVCPVHTGRELPPFQPRPTSLDAQLSLLLPDPAPKEATQTERAHRSESPGSDQLFLPLF